MLYTCFPLPKVFDNPDTCKHTHTKTGKQITTTFMAAMFCELQPLSPTSGLGQNLQNPRERIR